MNILAIGDVCGQPGVDLLSKRLTQLKRRMQTDLTVVNGENAVIRGITPKTALSIFSAGADVITLGNHTFSQRQIGDFLDDNRYILRPYNMAPQLPGRGYIMLECAGKTVCIVNLIGRLYMDFNVNSPFAAIETLIRSEPADLYIVDFHAQATSEKKAMGYFLDRLAPVVVFGTHTHVQTADKRILPNGGGYISDLGMTGSAESVLGVRYEQSISFFRGDLPGRFESATEDLRIQGALFQLNQQGKCTSISLIDDIDE